MVYELNGYTYDVLGPQIRRERILGLLLRAKFPITKKELADLFDVHPSTIQHDLEILEARGYKLGHIHGNWKDRPTGYFLERRRRKIALSLCSKQR